MYGVLLFLCLAIQPAYAALNDQSAFNGESAFTPQFEFYVDSDRIHNIETITSLPGVFKTAPKAGYVGGYNRAVHWLRFVLPPLDSPGETLFLRINPAYTDYITLYMPDPSLEHPSFTRMESGELVEDWQQKNDRALVFELEAASQPRTLYLRIESTNTITLVAKVYNLSGYLNALRIDHILSGTFIGLLLTLFCINASNTKGRKEKEIRYYLLLIVSSMGVFLAGGSWMLPLIPDDWKAWATYLPQLTTLFYISCLTLFYHVLLGFDWQKTPLSFGLSSGYLLLIGGGFIALSLDYYVEYMPWFMVVTTVYLLWIMGIAFSWVLHRRSEGKLLFVAVLLGVSGILGTALSHSGVVSGGTFLLYSYTAGTLASIVVFQGMISRRMRLVEQQHVTVLLEKEHAQAIAERERADKEQKAQFISMLSHELKTPLSVISMGTAQTTLSDKARAHLLRAINDMGRVIDRCAVLEQVDSQVQTHQEAIELTSLIDILIQQTQTPQRIQWQPPQTNVLVHSDADWLRVILSNLIDNALKYSPPDTKIEITLLHKPDYTCLDISNWTADPLPDGTKIFAKYYRAKSAHKQTGSGLGLYIVKRLVDQLSAHIDYQALPIPEKKLNKIVMHLCLPDLQ